MGAPVIFANCAAFAAFCAIVPFGAAHAAVGRAGEPVMVLALAGHLSSADRGRPFSSGSAVVSAAAPEPFIWPANLRSERTFSPASAGLLLALADTGPASSSEPAAARVASNAKARPVLLASAAAKPVMQAAPPTLAVAVAQPASISGGCTGGLANNGVFSAGQVLERVRTSEATSNAAAVQSNRDTWVVDPRDGTLARTLGRWTSDAQWQLNWDADRDFIIDTRVTMSGTLREAIEVVMMSLAHTDYPLQAAMNPSTCTLRVSRFMDHQPR